MSAAAAAGHVYLIRQGKYGPIKIGFSTHPQARIAELQTASHCELRLVCLIRGSHRDERTLHKMLRSRRLRGEWFSLSEDELAMVVRIMKKEMQYVAANLDDYLYDIESHCSWDDIFQPAKVSA